MNRPSNIFTLGIFLTAIMAGCEKATTPFSADAVQPATGQINVNVLRGTGSASNVIVKAVDPSGNIFTTISDSNGVAVFNPLPFVNGKWTVEMPSQNNRCFNQTENPIITSGVNHSPITFQYGVGVTLSLSTAAVSVLSTDPALIQVSQSWTLNTQNDCGIPWEFTLTMSGLSYWTMNGSGHLSSGQSYSVNLTSGQSVGYDLYNTTTSLQLSTNLSSPLGSTNYLAAVF